MRITGFLLFLTFLFSCSLSIFLVYREFRTGIEREVKNEAYYLKLLLENTEISSVESLFFGQESNRITLIKTDGTVFYDNSVKAETMENHADRPEIAEANETGIGETTRLSKTLSQQTYYYAVKLSSQMILRVASTTDSIFTIVKRNLPILLVLSLFFILLMLISINKQTEKLILPINQLNLEHPLDNEVYEELSPLLKRLDKQNQLLDKQYRILKEKQEEFATVTDCMKEALIVLSSKAIILSINKAALTLFSVAEAEINHRHILSVSRNQELKEAFEEALSGRFSSRDFQLNGHFYEIISSPVSLSNNLFGAVLLIVDITEKQRGDQMRKEFAANVSHELKTPLTSISGYAELLKCGMVKPEDQPRFAETIYQEAAHMIRLIEDIIWLSKLDEGNAGAKYEEVCLYHLAEEIIGRLKPEADKKNVSLFLNGTYIKFYGIRRIIEEILYNLCDNAIKYNKDGGKVEINLKLESDQTYITVSDTGIGIEQQDRERIFERFYRADKSHSKQIRGTGLGLSIVKHGVLLHKGSIQVDSTPGEGCTIQILLKGKETKTNVTDRRETRKTENLS